MKFFKISLLLISTVVLSTTLLAPIVSKTTAPTLVTRKIHGGHYIKMALTGISSFAFGYFKVEEPIAVRIGW